MRAREIRKLIHEATEDEEATGRFADLLRRTAVENGASVSGEQIKDVVQFVRDYIEHVPVYLEHGYAAAKRLGLAPEMSQMLGEIEMYWFTPDDLIPDHLGLIGVMDDAYASLCLLHALSECCKSVAGQSLLEHDIAAANRGIRNLIGEPVASHIEQKVRVTIDSAHVQRALQRIATDKPVSFGTDSDPIWGNTSLEELVDMRLGALGLAR